MPKAGGKLLVACSQLCHKTPDQTLRLWIFSVPAMGQTVALADTQWLMRPARAPHAGGPQSRAQRQSALRAEGAARLAVVNGERRPPPQRQTECLESVRTSKRGRAAARIERRRGRRSSRGPISSSHVARAAVVSTSRTQNSIHASPSIIGLDSLSLNLHRRCTRFSALAHTAAHTQSVGRPWIERGAPRRQA